MMKAGWSSEVRDALQLFRQPESVAFALLVTLATWASVLAPRVMGVVMPVAAVAAFVGATRLRQRMRMPAMDSEVWWIWGIVIALIGCSAFWSPDIGYGLERTAKIASSFAMAIFLFFLAGELSQAHRARLRGLLIVSYVFALALIALYMLINDDLVRELMGHNTDEAAIGANRAAVVLAVLMWPTALAAFEDGKTRVTYLLPLVALGALMLTYSQTAPVVILVGSFVYLVCCVIPRLAVYLVAAAGVILLLGMPFFFLDACSSLLKMDINWAQAAAGERVEIWCAVSSFIPDRLIFGHGVEAARFVQDWGMAHIYFKGDGILHPHNAALQIWYEYGVVGAVLASLIWCACVRRISHLGPHARAICFAALSSIAVVGFISHGLWQSWWLGTVGVVPALFRMVSGPVWFSSRD